MQIFLAGMATILIGGAPHVKKGQLGRKHEGAEIYNEL